MKNNKVVVPVLLMGLSLAAMVGCKPKIDAEPLSGMQTIADFSQGIQQSFGHSNGWNNGEPFNVVWNEENVLYADGVAKLEITENDGNILPDIPYYAGELRSDQHFGYGDYQVRMKPSNKKGTASTFFTYTGPSEGNPHDEIDIEFLGKDTTKVQFNFFVNGKGGNEYMYDLGFDASKEFHDYGFRWEEDKITWFVDGEPVYQVKESKSKPLPHTPGKMMMNHWAGTDEAKLWMGEYAGPGQNEYSEYVKVETSATPIGDVVVEEPDPESTVDWSTIESVKGLEFVTSDGTHTVTETNGSYKIDYSNVAGGSYNNVQANLGNAAKDKNWVSMKIKNNDTTKPATVRVDVMGAPTNPTANNKSVCNMLATMNGKSAQTDLDWGGSTFPLEAGQEAEVLIYYEGVANNLLAMLDSCVYGDSATHSGSVTISDIKFAKEGELKLPAETPETPEDPGEPSEPSDSNHNIDWSKISSTKGLDFVTSDGTHTVVENDGSYQIDYTNVPGGSYNNVQANLGNAAKDTNWTTMKIKNNNSTTSTVRVDVMGTPTNPTTNNKAVCNMSATMDGKQAPTDLDWGGSSFTIGAGKEVEIEIYYEGIAENLLVMVDSCVYGDVASHSGSVTVSDIKFAKDGELNLPEVTEPETPETSEPSSPSEPETSEPETSEPESSEPESSEPESSEPETSEPEVPDTSAKIELSTVTFVGNIGSTSYTVVENNADNSMNVKYSNVKGNSYYNINAPISSLANDKDTFTAKFTNNGTAAVTVRIDIQGTTKVGETDALNQSITVSPTQSGATTDLVWGGSTFKVPAGETVEITLKYDVGTTKGTAKNVMFFFDSSTYNDETNHSGDITISDMKFSGEATSAPVEPNEPSTPSEPTNPGETTTLTFASTELYTVTTEDGKVNVQYSGVGGQTYKNIVSNIASVAQDKDTFSITVKNNGTETVELRVDIQGATKVNNTDSCNLSATSTSSGGARTDLEWGGSFTSVAAGETVTLTIKYEPNGTHGAATNLLVYLDSSTNSSATHSGNVTLSNFVFSQSN